ncbi:MAG: FHA domain-containing protein [Granulosicoccaceae bacterium]
MMKLILTDGESEAREFPLHKTRTEIGRRSSNDIQLRGREVSGQHAVVEQQGDNYVLIDSKSTNGTLLNGTRINEAATLTPGATVRIGKFTLTARAVNNVANNVAALADGDDEDIPVAMPPSHSEEVSSNIGNAVIKIQTGAKAGTAVNITKPVTTIGRPGVQVVAINRQSDGFYALHVETMHCEDQATVNDQVLDDAPVKLGHSDVLRVAGTEVCFEVEYSN